MAKARVLLDTNIIVDCLGVREPFYEPARRVLLCGRVGEFELWSASSQFTDLIISSRMVALRIAWLPLYPHSKD